jgi:hypothetical protein
MQKKSNRIGEREFFKVPDSLFLSHRWQYDILLACHIFKAYRATPTPDG